ncbi:MAG: hypothetical protein JNK82_31865, partial [Myxococcaceae bacterium]|nr:hypothetical protein [Myxococcaceae bacterium]
MSLRRVVPAVLLLVACKEKVAAPVTPERERVSPGWYAASAGPAGPVRVDWSLVLPHDPGTSGGESRGATHFGVMTSGVVAVDGLSADVFGVDPATGVMKWRSDTYGGTYGSALVSIGDR